MNVTVPAALAALVVGFALAGSAWLRGDARADVARFIVWSGSETPSLALNDLPGRAHAIADYRGRVVLVNFWATWCEPCRAEMASMQRLQERLAGRPFTVLLVNYGEARMRVGEFVKREALGFSVLLDPNQDASRAWRVRVLPSSFLVDAEGRVRYTVVGEMDWASQESVDTVQTLLR
ncbi:MAG TPA: TlpA disulfide reductase family protein [Methylomirabilota bacterium]|nr:TlpA disulfide reductase family protein [Methylomirabilota bacterium]